MKSIKLINLSFMLLSAGYMWLMWHLYHERGSKLCPYLAIALLLAWAMMALAVKKMDKTKL